MKYSFVRRLIASAFAGAALSVSAVQAADLSDMSWDQIVDQAKKEGSLNWYQWYLQPEFRELVKQFESEYGIKVTIPEGGGGANKDKFLAERNRDVGDIDVLSVWTGALTEFTEEELTVGPLTAMLPEAPQLNTTPENYDTRGYAVAFWGNQAGLAYNSARVEEKDLPQNVEQLSAWMESNPKSLGFNVAEGGSGKGFFTAVGRHLVTGVDFDDGEVSDEKLAGISPLNDWFSARKDQFIVTASNADSVTRLNDGELTLTASYEDFVAGLQKKGEISADIKFYVPEFGMPGGANVVFVPANAKNKAAAVVFIHWLTSADVQAAFNKQFGSVPQNSNASDEFALVPQAQRAFVTAWPAEPFLGKVLESFVENVVQK